MKEFLRKVVREKTNNRTFVSYLLEGRAKITKAVPPKDMESLFNNYYNNNYWRNNESVSGGGSTVEGTKFLREKLENLFVKYNIKKILDLPCGDYNWMKYVKKDGIEYIGGDIVQDMVDKNNNLFKNNSINFIKLDITKDDLPKADLILVRDCLVHLSYENILKALNQIKQSGSKYLLATSFSKWPRNFDIPNGMWRPVNLEKTPFLLGKPIEIILEESEKSAIFSDKSLLLYCVDSINLFELKK